MDKKAQINSTLKLVGSVIVVLLFLGVLAITFFIVLTNLTPAVASVDSQTVTLTAEQNNTNVTTAGIFLTSCYQYVDSGGAITTFTPRNITLTISSGNYTLSGCKVTPTATSEYANRLWNITYSYTYDKSAKEVVSISNNLTTGVAQFFTQIPVLFTILGIIVIIASIVLIVFFVSRMSGRGGGI